MHNNYVQVYNFTWLLASVAPCARPIEPLGVVSRRCPNNRRHIKKSSPLVSPSLVSTLSSPATIAGGTSISTLVMLFVVVVVVVVVGAS